MQACDLVGFASQRIIGMYNIAIVGKMGSGKSSLANYLIDVEGFTRVANAGAIKALAEMAYGPIDKSKDYVVSHDYGDAIVSGREILQVLGSLVKDLDQYFWLKSMVRSMEHLNPPFVCDDTRFPFEARFLQSEGWKVARLNVPEGERIARYETLYGREPTAEELAHESEVSVDYIKPDIELDGTDPTILIAEKLIDALEK